MARYVFRDGKFIDPKTGQPMLNGAETGIQDILESKKFPSYTPDIPDYHSPVTGKLVSGRVARREDLKRTGSIELDPQPKPLRDRQKPQDVDINYSEKLNEDLRSIVNTLD